MSVFNQVADGLKRVLPGRMPSAPAAQSVHYNCVCDEEVSLRCANDSCSRRIDPGSNMMVAPDGSVLCSENCAVAFVGAVW